jgi:molybdopterin molybdotransferase
MLSLTQALKTVQDALGAAHLELRKELIRLSEAQGRVLAEDIAADRDYPPFNRSTRDGFAVRSADVGVTPVELRLRGEVRAGSTFDGKVIQNECVAIMTGAPLPAGTDAVVMLEYTEARGDKVLIQRVVQPRENVVQQGSEAVSGACVLRRGRRLGASELGLLATVGKFEVEVYGRPTIAILATGDEVVPVEKAPQWFQIRNSNATALAAQVTAVGGIPRLLGISPDSPQALRELIQEGLKADLLLMAGGVSVGKYDFVEQVLADLGAEFYFQSVALRPGKPLVFGRAAGKLFFGLPGNPISTFVTFALFGRPTVEALGGGKFAPPLFLRGRLDKSVQQKTSLTVFLPARVENSSGEPIVHPVTWQGSGDLVGVAEANCFIVLHPAQTGLAAGDWVDVMMKDV